MVRFEHNFTIINIMSDNIVIFLTAWISLYVIDCECYSMSRNLRKNLDNVMSYVMNIVRSRALKYCFYINVSLCVFLLKHFSEKNLFFQKFDDCCFEL